MGDKWAWLRSRLRAEMRERKTDEKRKKSREKQKKEKKRKQERRGDRAQGVEHIIPFFRITTIQRNIRTIINDED